MKFNSRYLTLGVLGLVASLINGDAKATTVTVTANMQFVTALTLTNPTPINLGQIKAATAAAYVIDTTGAVTTSGSGVIIGGTTAAGIVHIVGDSTATIAISTGSYSAASNGVVLSAATCKYGSTTETLCDAGITGQAAPGTGADLTLGVTATSDGNAAANTTASPTFVVTVIYG